MDIVKAGVTAWRNESLAEVPQGRNKICVLVPIIGIARDMAMD